MSEILALADDSNPTFELPPTPEVKESLWHNRSFLRLWTSETISQFGSQFTGLALPLTAVIILGATVLQLSILNFVGSVSWLLFGLGVGVWVDRHRKRRIMVTSNIFRGSLLALIPIAAVLGLIANLGIFFLYVIGFFVGFLQVFYDITYQAFLPSLVRRDQLVEGNSRLQASASTAQVAGPTLAGIVIGIITAPIAIAIDACSFFASAFSLSRIRTEEDLALEKMLRVPGPGERSFWIDLKEGLGVVLRDARLRMIAGCTGTSNFFSTAFQTILPLYFLLRAPDGLGVSTSLIAVTLGIIFSVGSIGAIVGVVIATRTAEKIGVGPAIIASALIFGLGGVPYYLSGSLVTNPLFSVAGLNINWNIIAIMAGQFVISIGVVVYNINQVSLRQALVPIRLQGRMNATMRFLVWGTIPLGALAGGLLGTFLGLRTAVGIMILGVSLSFVWVLLSPVRSLKEIPESME
ncbi:MAG TPA: MFS transporter [Candidatus Angelobacter sp.]|nr:MFS transporter [Candidatus Angelobacter sp.]